MRKARAGRRVEAQRKVIEENALNLKKFHAVYMGSKGFLNMYLFTQNAGFALIAAIDAAKGQGYPADEENAVGGPSADGNAACLIGKDWCLQVIDVAFLAKLEEQPPLTTEWHEGGKMTKGGTA